MAKQCGRKREGRERGNVGEEEEGRAEHMAEAKRAQRKWQKS